MNSPSFRIRDSIVRPASLLLALSCVPLFAADKTWDGEGANDFWLTAANWDPTGGGGTAPVATDWLYFDGALRLTPNNNFTAGTVFQNITFNGGASAFTLGGNALTLAAPAEAAYGGGLGAPYIGGSISNASPGAQTISLPLTLANGHHHIVGDAGGGVLNLSGTITLGSAASVSFSSGVNVNGTGLANVNGILGGWATMAVPTGWAALDGGNNVVEYTAYTDVAAGGAIANAASSNVRIPDSGANVTLAAGGTTDINTLHFGTAPTGNQTIDVAAGRILRLGAKGGIFNASRQITGVSRVLTIGTGAGVGAVTAGGAANTAGDLYLIETPFIGNTGNQLVMNSRMTNNGTGAVTVHTFGHISLPAITGGHTHSGGTHIHGGRIQTTPNNLGTGPIVIYPGGQLFFNANGTCTNDIFMAGYGNAESSGNGAIRAGGTARIFTGLMTLTADAATANGTFNGPITGPGGFIVGAGTGNGVGTTIIGATNDYAGDTLINGTNATGASTLQMTTGRPHTMPHGAGKGNLILRGHSATVTATLNLNGTDQTVNGLSSMGTHSSAIISNSAVGMGTLIVGDNDATATFAGQIRGANVGLTKMGAGTQTLSGPNSYGGNTTVNGGRLVFSTSGSYPASSLVATVNSNATLDVGEVTPLTLSTMTSSNGTTVLALPAGGSAITTTNLNSLGDTNYITITSIPSINSYPAQFVAIKYSSLNGALNFGLAGALPPTPGTPFSGYISNNIANGSVDFVVTGGPASLKWQGYAGGSPNASWDTSTANWIPFIGGSALAYSDGSFVRFDNSASNGVATLNQNVVPAGMTVSNTVLAYTINGGSKIGGVGGLAKQGSGTLVLENTGINDFTGDITISAGTLQIGNNNSAGNLPATTPILNNGALVYTRNDSVSVSNLISGAGTLTQNGNGGVLSVAGVNTFTGVTTISQGTLQTFSSAALGATNGGTTVASGSTLDVAFNSINLGQEAVTISGNGAGGQGALVNNSGDNATFVGPNVSRLIMAADAAVGGSGRLDLRSTDIANPTLASLNTGGQPRKLTKVGGNQFAITGVTVDPTLGDIEIQAGALSIEAATTGLGNPANSLTVVAGATLKFFNMTNQLNKVMTLNGDGTASTLWSDAGNNTVIGPMTLNGGCVVDCDGGTSLNLNNVITGSGTLTKIDTGLLTFSGNSPAYAGGIAVNSGVVSVAGSLNTAQGVTVSGGKFSVNGSLLGAGVTNAAGTFFAGSGSCAGAVSISGQMSPGDTNGVIGTLTVGPLVLESGGALDFDLTSTNAVGGGTNDLIVVNGDLTVNGNAITINPIGLLQTGASRKYRLFNYSGNLIWNGDLTVTSPNNYTYAVDTNTAGQVNIVASGGPPAWNGGSVVSSLWTDTANWNGATIVSGDTLYFAGNNRLNNTNNTAADTSYTDIGFNFDAGLFVLDGNSINLGGNVVNISPNTQTINLPLTLSGNRTFNGGTGTGSVIVGGPVTNTVAAGILTLAGNGILSNRLASLDPNSITNTLLLNASNANWTMMDNPTATPVVMPMIFDVQAGTYNHGSGASAPQFLSTATAVSRVGVIANTLGTLNVANGAITFGNRLNTGAGGNTLAAVNQTGGTVNIRDVFQGSDSAATAATTMNISGGLFNVSDVEGNPRNFFLASRGTNILTVSNSGVVNCATLDMSRNAAGNTLGSVGVVHLNGGMIAASRIGAATSAAQAGGTPTATFNFNGGTLKANASSTTWIQGNAASPAIPIACIIKAGGAIVDSTNFNVSILESLQHDSALGGTPDGGLRKIGTGTLTIGAGGNYTGDTVISNGTLVVNTTLSGSAVRVAVGTLAGSGTSGKNLEVQAGGTVSPGTGIGTLTFTNAISLSGVAYMEINATTSANDLLRSITGNISYGGTLTVTNIGGLLTNGHSFKLFNAGGGSYIGGFSTIQLPGLGVGQSWNTSQLSVSGTISVVGNPAPPAITSVGTLGTDLVISGGNGITNGTFTLVTSTNVAALMTTWTTVGAGTFDGNGNFAVATPIQPGTPARFFRVRLP